VQVLRTALVTAVVAVACAASAAPAQAQLVRLVPFCDDVTVGGPASGFRIDSAGGVVLAFRTGGLAGIELAPVNGMLIAQSFPPTIGATTVEVYTDSNMNGRVDPGEPLIETINAPDPCAPPLPTTKDQCKNGGWRNFPGFRNQGDCVSFVATNGKNQSSGR
jgi:hypothetical protein